MEQTPTPGSADAVRGALARVAGLHDLRARAEADELVGVLEWAVAHGIDPEASPSASRHGALHFGGVGCPLVLGEDDVWELAVALRRSADSCLRYLGDALELRYRLPRLWDRVAAYEVAVWRALKVARATRGLGEDAALWVDEQLAGYAHTIDTGQISRTVARALAVFDPEEADARRRSAADQRRFDIELFAQDDALDSRRILSGVVEVHGLLDRADALDLNDAITRIADELARFGSTESLDVRRSMAAGELGRSHLTLDFEPDSDHPEDVIDLPARAVAISVRLDPEGVATLQQGQTPVLVEQLLDWCTRPNTTVNIRPVIDLNSRLESDGYQPSPKLRDHVEARDQQCVFPYCTRRRTDLDHAIPHDAGGPTASDNLARLCRAHHRARGRGRWRYRHLDPGRFEWTSPTGTTHTVDHTDP